MDFKTFCDEVNRLIKEQDPLLDQTIHLKRRVPHGKIEVIIGYISPEFAYEGEIISNHGLSVKEFLNKDAYWEAQVEEVFEAMMKDVTETDYGYHLKDLLGASDVAEILGWDVRKVSAYGRTGKDGFPAPIGTIGRRPVWYRGDILRYKEKNQKDRVD